MTVYIVYDLEMTVKRQKTHISDTIEIGAVKLKELNNRLEMVDLFQCYVCPSRVKRLSQATVAFTGITQADVDAAQRFPESVRSFQAWIGQEEYYLCSWGPDDKRQLISECQSHHIGLDWIRNHNDLQKHWAELHQLEQNQRIGLVHALESLHIPFAGKQHSALNDAANTAEILMKLHSRFNLEKNTMDEERLLPAEIVYRSGRFKNQPFQCLLKKLQIS